MVVVQMAAPLISDGRASGNSTLRMICQVVLPMDSAASITPESTSFREPSTMRAT